MEVLLFVSSTTYYLLICSIAAFLLLLLDSRRKSKAKFSASTGLELPGPTPWPIIGSLHLMGSYDVPYKAFGALAEKYGQVYKLQLGNLPCVVVNGLDNIREVLMSKAQFFDARPNFKRYNDLFAGDKANSLAFSDWSDAQKVKREMLRAHTFPRAFSARFHELDTYMNIELNDLTNVLKTNEGSPVALKPLLLHSCANIFTSYFTSHRFERDHPRYAEILESYDEIFYEVNQGYAADFLPWLMPLHTSKISRMTEHAHKVRDFVVKEILADKLAAWTPGQTQLDYVDSLIEHVKSEVEPKLSMDSALFALEDIIGGHGAVANFLLKVLSYVVTRPDVQRKIQEEVDAVTENGREISLADRTFMPYTEAVILEAVRIIASPIVPHVASQDGIISGFKVEKGSMIFLNNYDLNMNPKLWDSPEEFRPERFISPEGRLLKPEFFLPFSCGRRSCMGYKIVQFVCFGTLATICQRFNIHPVSGESYKVPITNLALPYKTFNLRFESRKV
ncbi:unnamed protein product [Bemisia tabaci]|uniref:Cytochrome P450 n=1 Tax=Bemisia tabaci TaxID=7038 RepID=A0A9P0F612_BEMTA|nr:cytochrome P450 [Bemisia tabaci]CAH0393486.1 unnamed protein product [Bemisia tabaci]